MAEVVGVVAELWRYPVKSMQGERLLSVKVTPGGVMGDRAYAVIDGETGYITSIAVERQGWLAEVAATVNQYFPRDNH